MEYTMEELIPIVNKLIKKYTSNESTSVTYDTARMIMAAVLYCINENVEFDALVYENIPPSEVMYNKGYEIVISKVYEAKKIYEEIVRDFEDYGCENYRDTVVKGMPAFFEKYDPKFCPQNHILMLDYPLLYGKPNLCGVDLILEYLKGIQTEKEFLVCFSKYAVKNVLASIISEYKELFFDNICEAVLFRAVNCLIVDKNVKRLELDSVDYEEIRDYFQFDDVEKIQDKVNGLINIIMNGLEIKTEYFGKASKDYAVMVSTALNNGSSFQFY